ncbi:transketolase C-terminal domain-containing protein [Variovorax ginsengisoli]|uniref:Transketolase C-terminal domain-containing protein n=1 Tax=Variovorax ginsengisoli TaxID=363844 RepID=A0ABT8SI07_9BURK|nr:transketolase C-terminal domain-containing protein [Variovorax ginsengisoli]MDN8618657.1 transketolase C-terminal domain-containing protein [Variovorax ginsengisoli]MDO1537827.1 transketolase C-terminal domain-containing protein [Variovorax ginsengisoli]
MSDGELDEGSTWEAAMGAAHHRLSNLICLVDINNQQADGPSGKIMGFEPLADKWAAFGWHVQRVDGNDLPAVIAAFDAARALNEDKPRVILFDTLMGRGVPFPEIVGMTADLAKYTDLHLFAQAFPERFLQIGMAEQLLMASAGGMAKEGFIPFATTYAVFGTRRAYDFVYQVIAEENLNVKMCCALPGLTTGYGPSHQATEDLALMRGIPGLTIIDPCDALDIEQAVPQMANHEGPVYMRLPRGNVPLVLDEYDYKFELGKAKLIRDGKSVLVISSGFMTMRSLEAAQQLQADGIDVAVLHVPTIKPLDEATILAEVRRLGRLVVVAENHSVIGGLGEAVAGLLMRSGVATTFRQIGLPDAFLDAGALPTLHDRYGISTQAMSHQIKGWV